MNEYRHQEAPIDNEQKLIAGYGDFPEPIQNAIDRTKTERRNLRHELRQHNIQRTFDILFEQAQVPKPAIAEPLIVDLAAGAVADAEGIWDFVQGREYDRNNQRQGKYIAVEVDTPQVIAQNLIREPHQSDLYMDGETLAIVPRTKDQLKNPLQVDTDQIFMLGDVRDLQPDWKQKLPAVSPEDNSRAIHFLPADITEIEEDSRFQNLTEKKLADFVFIGQPDITQFGSQWGKSSSAETWINVMEIAAQLLRPGGFLVVTLFHESELPTFNKMFDDIFWHTQSMEKLAMFEDTQKTKWWKENAEQSRNDPREIVGSAEKQPHHIAFLFRKR